MRGVVAVLAVGLGLLASAGAIADPPPPPPGIPPAVRVPFYPIASNLVPNAVPSSAAPLVRTLSTRNRIWIARTRRQANSWSNLLAPADRESVQANYFPWEALVGVFFYRDREAQVKVTGLWRSGDTLQLALELVPWPEYVCNPPPGSPGCGGPAPTIPAPTSGDHPYTVVAVRQTALAGVTRVVVIEEVQDAPQVIELVPSFVVSCPIDPVEPIACPATDTP